MPTLRREFYSTLRHMLLTMSLELLTDRLSTNDPHNISARILRQGVAISAFASLEKYLEARAEVLVQQIPASAITGSSLGADLREFLSVDAVRGLANRLRFTDKASQQAYADIQLAKLAKYSSIPAGYTALGFSPEGSNVAEGDIAKVLKVFGIEQPWKRLGEVASEIGSARLSLKDDYNGLAKTRHRSAHEPGSNIPSADLKTHIETSILIAVCFDCLASSIARVMTVASDFASFKALVNGYSRNYRFIDSETNGSWIERSSGGRRVLKRYADEASAIAGASTRNRSAIVIVRDTQGVPLAFI